MADADPPRPAGAPGTLAASADARVEDLARHPASGAGNEQANPRGCPFLVAETGGWRLAVPSREHRCGAFSPPAPLSSEKQSRLCLTSNHASCATYLASITARTERLGAAPVRRTTRWGFARTTSVIEDPGGIRARILAAVLDRRRWPAIPAVILVTTLFVLALSGFRAGLPTSPVATASPGRPDSTATATTPATPPAATEAPLESAPPGSESPTAPPPTAEPTAAPGTPAPSPSFRTYRVKSGDTLGDIAARFGTTVRAIARLNDIDDPGSLQIGQVLLIP